jgi:hypothetical protein
MSKRQPRTLLEHSIDQVGILKGARVCTFICQWTIAVNAIGRPITIEEYGEWWNESERTVYRHQAEFRRVFDVPSPQVFADQALVRAEALQRGVAGLGRLPLDVVMA